MVVPGRIAPWMIGSNVSALRSGTVYMKLSAVSRQIPQNTHCWGNTRPYSRQRKEAFVDFDCYVWPANHHWICEHICSTDLT